MRQTVFGIFDTANEAQNAVKNLLNAGFTKENVDVRAKNTSGASTTQTEKTDKGDREGSFFSNLFGSDTNESKTYTEVARRGSVVTVHTASLEESERAAAILDEYGAIDANERAQGYRTEGTRGTTDTTAGTNKNIPVIEEEMQVGKREVETGGVRVRSRIVERPVEEKLRLREEHVNVERNPVDRPATEADFRNFKEGETEFTEHAEVPVVNKEARVVEEVNLKKESSERKETVRDSVRRTDVDVKQSTKDKDVTRKDR